MQECIFDQSDYDMSWNVLRACVITWSLLTKTFIRCSNKGLYNGSWCEFEGFKMFLLNAQFSDIYDIETDHISLSEKSRAHLKIGLIFRFDVN